MKPNRIKIWDLPVRIFHWTMVLNVTVSVITGFIAGVALKYHFWAGYGVLTLVLFRIMWGLIGSEHARFASFIRGPRAVLATLRQLVTREPLNFVGHNPVGALMVVLLLLGLVVQTATGLFANDDIFNEGPLYSHVSKAVSDWLTGIHELNADIILGLVALHIAAIAYHWRRKGENLVLPMLNGYKESPIAIVTKQRSSWLALSLLLLSVAFVGWLVNQ